MRARDLCDSSDSNRLAVGLAKISRGMWAILTAVAVVVFCATLLNATKASLTEDQKSIASLDKRYQDAVKNNDAATMDRLLADDFILVTGSGKTYTKSDLLEEARSGHMHYEQQGDLDQTVRVWGNTAVITARLTASGTNDGEPFEYVVWFSDIYLRTPQGWRYTFAQSSLPMPRQGSSAR